MLAEFAQSGAISFFEIHMLNFLTVHPIFHEFSSNVSPRAIFGIFTFQPLGCVCEGTC